MEGRPEYYYNKFWLAFIPTFLAPFIADPLQVPDAGIWLPFHPVLVEGAAR
jgi:hypothetical protein